MERILQCDESVMKVRVFHLENDLNFKQGDKIPLLQPLNEYLLAKQGDYGDAIGIVKVDSYRRLGHHSELIGDIYLNSEEVTKDVFDTLSMARDNSRSGISDTLHLYKLSEGFHFTIKETSNEKVAIL